MASGTKGNKSARILHPMSSSDFGMRAGQALDLVVPGPHRDKIVARHLGVSVRMAKYLRAGQHWSIARLNQASAVFGGAFDALLGDSAAHYASMAEISERLSRVEDLLDTTLVGGTAAQPFPPEVRPLHGPGEGRDAGGPAPAGDPVDRVGADLSGAVGQTPTRLALLRGQVAADRGLPPLSTKTERGV